MASFSAGPGTGRCRRICMPVLAVFLSLLSAGCSTAPRGHDTAGIPRPDRAGLAVLNFKNTTARDQASQFQPWEYGIATMLSTDLEALGVFNIVERERLRDIVREYELQKSDLVDKETVVKLGRLTAAKYILTGSFAEMNGDLRIAVQIFSVEEGIQLGAASMNGETDKFFMIEKKLFVKVIDFLEVMLDEKDKARIVNSVETKSVDASLRNYSGEMAVARAEELKRIGKNKDAILHLQEARKKFSEALEYDPNFLRAKKNLETLAMAIPITL